MNDLSVAELVDRLAGLRLDHDVVVHRLSQLRAEMKDLEAELSARAPAATEE
jgi:uncharacterized membrane protein